MVDFGNVGDVVEVDPRLLTTLLDAGYLPIVSPLAADEEGNVYNVNADAIASALAVELAADKLILLSDVPGVLAKPGDPESRISRLSASDARKLAKSPSVTGGMVAKLEEISRVVEAGVAAVHIVNGNQRNALLSEVFGDKGSGTMIIGA
jgi:acetylglutamate kinase